MPKESSKIKLYFSLQILQKYLFFLFTCLLNCLITLRESRSTFSSHLLKTCQHWYEEENHKTWKHKKDTSLLKQYEQKSPLIIALSFPKPWKQKVSMITYSETFFNIFDKRSLEMKFHHLLSYCLSPKKFSPTRLIPVPLITLPSAFRFAYSALSCSPLGYLQKTIATQLLSRFQLERMRKRELES